MLNDSVDKTDGHYIYWSESFSSALRKVLVALRDKKRFIAVTGDKGYGKTELFNMIGEGLFDAGYNVQALDVTSSFTPVELLTLLAVNLNVILENQTKLNLLQLLSEHYRNTSIDVESVLLLDNCNRLAYDEFLEDLKYIAENSKNVQFVMFGESDFISRFNSVYSLFNNNIEVIKLDGLAKGECTTFVNWLQENIFSEQKKLPKKVMDYIHETAGCNPGKFKLLAKIAFEIRQENDGKITEPKVRKRWEFLNKF